MTPLSVVIIAFNEERNISRCLESVSEIADEIIVVDSGSTDRTEKMCTDFGAKFIHNYWPGYTEQKNFANAQASNDHILSLDADEAISTLLKYNIRNEKENGFKNGYLMNRMTNYCGKWIKHGAWYPDRQLRLFDRRQGQWEGERIHERFVLRDNSGPVHIEGDMLHYSYYTIEEHVAQANYFTTITAEVAFQKGKNAGFIKIFCSPVIRFLRDYIFRAGFLDGYAGFLIAQISANATFLKYIKIRQLHQKSKSNPDGKVHH